MRKISKNKDISGHLANYEHLPWKNAGYLEIGIQSDSVYDEIYGQAEPYLDSCQNKVHTSLSYDFARRLLALIRMPISCGDLPRLESTSTTPDSASSAIATSNGAIR